MPSNMLIAKTEDQFILNGRYHIPFSRCDSTENIARCAAEFAGESWSSTALVYAFIAATARLELDDDEAAWPPRGAWPSENGDQLSRGLSDGVAENSKASNTPVPAT
jgi:hypothetical protein